MGNGTYFINLWNCNSTQHYMYVSPLTQSISYFPSYIPLKELKGGHFYLHLTYWFPVGASKVINVGDAILTKSKEHSCLHLLCVLSNGPELSPGSWCGRSPGELTSLISHSCLFSFNCSDLFCLHPISPLNFADVRIPPISLPLIVITSLKHLSN